MSALHISKVAVGCQSFDALRKRQELRRSGGVVPIYTRFRPKRADELIGGSIYWIIKHRITARQKILGFATGEEQKTVIQLDPELVPVKAWPKRAHQGWRYLPALDAPQDFDGADAGMMELPPQLLRALSALALL
jgi:hypothetical protein